MTISLCCTHCEQPMMIARRKPGSRVTCPACGHAVTVPDRQPTAGVKREPAIELPTVLPEMTNQPTAAATRAETKSTSRRRPRPRVDHPEPPPEFPINPPATPDELDEFKIITDRPIGPAQADLLPRLGSAPNVAVIPKSVAVAVLVLAFLAVALAFSVGFLVGRLKPSAGAIAPTDIYSIRTHADSRGPRDGGSAHLQSHLVTPIRTGGSA